MSMDLTASVIICTRNRCNDLVACLQSVATQSKVPEELIIVDSSDEPLMQQALFTQFFTSVIFPATNLTYLHTRPGLTYQRNQGIAKAQGNIIYFFDDDVIISPSYLAQMQAIFTHYPEYAGGMGDITNITRNKTRYWWYRRFFLLPHEGGSGYFTWSGMPTHAYGTHHFKQVEVVGGCCMAFRTHILKQYYFDETMERYCYLEDADIAWRISRQYPLFYNPAAQLVHYESPHARDRRIDISAMFVYNYSYLFFKNVYAQYPLKIIAYCWSLYGLFLQAIITRDIQQLRGFYKGLVSFYTQKRKTL